MRWLAAGITLGCAFVIPSLAYAQRAPEPIGVSRARAATAAAAVRRRAPELAPRQIILDSYFIEVSGEYRKFINWQDVSGNDPAVVKNDTRDWTGGFNFNFGLQLGSLPIWAQAGAYYSAGLETNTTFEDGETVQGKINNYGAGAGARLIPLHTAMFALDLWAMGYYDWNEGDFDIIDDVLTRSEKRVHRSLIGDYGIGAIFMIDEGMGIHIGASYSGLFDKKNADESIRVKLGIILNPPREAIY